MNAQRISALQLGLHWFPERPGGLDRIYQNLIEALPDAGVDVRGLVAGSDAVARESNGVVRAFARPDRPLVERLRAARRAVRAMLGEWSPDVVVSHFALYSAPSLDLYRDRPLVSHFQGPWSDETGLERRATGVHLGGMTKALIERAVYRRSTRIIVLSSAFRDVLESRFGVPGEVIRVIPGCVDVPRFAISTSREVACETLGLPADRPIVVTVRRLARRMGIEDLIDSFRQVRHTVPDALLVIVGGGVLKDELAARVAQHGLENHVRLLGRIEDDVLPLVYRAADLSIVPTVALEGFGLTTVESLAAGTPVLVTPVGGLPEAVSGLSQDLVLPNFGANALAAGIVDALRGHLRLPSADACHAYARTGFDVPVKAARTAKVYQEAVRVFGEQHSARRGGRRSRDAAMMRRDA
ncbi:glycosyltransferase family 4 protein [Pararobbsia silviterrae]|uniref:Glycosyltransferase family 1 protein n=1 Tax=Pararobbsia silviterrae TaxID=1792498 RepID=A0A494X3N8_9BURK|nr:glycosyltransferase family 4 protein [Pararobbsia silviterrae]RKP45317.1 glycosyltransferase family 1 protein [Pararobbsia silviterrae]